MLPINRKKINTLNCCKLVLCHNVIKGMQALFYFHGFSQNTGILNQAVWINCLGSSRINSDKANANESLEPVKVTHPQAIVPS